MKIINRCLKYTNYYVTINGDSVAIVVVVVVVSLGLYKHVCECM